jgi:hypothetical protein
MEWVSTLYNARRFIFGGIAVLFVVSIILGMEFGSDNSPDYSDPLATFQFLGSNLKTDETSDDDVRLHVIAGPYRYDYSLSADAVTRTALPPILLSSMKTPRRWRYLEQKHVEELLGISTPPAAIAAFRKISAETKSKKAEVTEYLIAGGVLTVGAMLATGGALGYLLTYSDKADYNNEVFQKVLIDKDTWHPYAIQIKECRTNPSQVCANWAIAK